MHRLSTQLAGSGIPVSLSALINTIAVAGKDIAHRLQLGAMGGVLGCAGEENIQGETQKKLDVISNQLLKDYLLGSGLVRALASEEEENYVDGDAKGEYLVYFDPLDGSSNIDINSMVGTIFSVFAGPEGEITGDGDLLRPGREQLAAGYILYGPSVMLVMTTGTGVQMYTLDQRTGEYLLTVSEVKIPVETREFAINMSNQRFWAEPMQMYIGDLLAGSDGPRQKNFNMRWVAAMVADVHRILCRGGVFAYPWDSRDPGKPGKLRLMYEANPMAMLVEQAGGAACTDRGPILDLRPENIHQRVPVILGAAGEVATCLEYHQSQ